ncbi:ribosomal protein S5-alanine N-acetyltransferase [Vibrio palustris]|uniref:Putative ribosomal N-acetyltransferase YdaF n=1 Tax=Vibrio palustris TaxID=1918946 RepID=A0A1R4B2L6_9VIBR|nr:ribosomal protein S5-alanine N-acetyltransferase [Vibrio palustris]SJL83159.1 Putative ribosomal N-acetyltransferase YdaF [Vibrio palustris]
MYYVNKIADDFVLRTATVDDAVLISQYFSDNREYLKPWEPERSEAFYAPFSWRERLVKLHELHRLGMAYYLLIIDKVTGHMLGTISFSNLAKFPLYSCSVGYSLAQQAQGQGIMSRALTMACDYMFDECNVHRINAAYMPHNQRSAAVLKRIGFAEEGFAPQYLLIDGQWRDHCLVALLNPHWHAE